jgi:hypothetical protein
MKRLCLLTLMALSGCAVLDWVGLRSEVIIVHALTAGDAKALAEKICTPKGKIPYLEAFEAGSSTEAGAYAFRCLDS